jgi:hypothetical protein
MGVLNTQKLWQHNERTPKTDLITLENIVAS